ncbi:hypothetical protein KMW28_16700 [Flammeovirga yaeyamensis]|uniref:Uncharacterized protein n=1 Tax=Flammeovirga yaeyamensis TaxID=367791 RepID=A0AAX1N197_9BACT|nr:hypothetical protein [Flammeovirga yaeyamensis]MBB3698346.1 hypothetical protein [Flammeovirga yaeyamensis]NMF34301.1 hypothetical protein [Flammeovirga yaeyamensis]QWG01284.1 hypothetical protein KMW28_16700 [Flammeovirga yaeyamensis]
MKFTFLLSILLCFAFEGFAEGTFQNIKPVLERYTSIDDWENPNNWSPKVVPDKNSFISVKEKFFIIDFNTRSYHVSVGSIDVPAGSELTITNQGNLLVNNVLTINNKAALIIEGKLTAQKINIFAHQGEFTLEETGTIDAHEIFLKIDDYTADIRGQISSTYIDIGFVSKKGSLLLGNNASIDVQSKFYIRNKFKDNITGDIKKISSFECEGNEAICKGIKSNRLRRPTIVDFFDIEVNNQTAFIYWETLREKNCSKFIVEKSENGVDYVSIGEIPAAVNAREISPYELQDKNFDTNKENYYRLRTVQQDLEEFIWVRHLPAGKNDREEFGVAKVSPNPTNFKLILQLEFEDPKSLDIKLHHTQNESIWDIKPTIEGNKGIFNVHHYPAGNYILKVKNKEQLIYSGNVVIYATNSKGNLKNSQAIIIEEE